MERKGVFAMRKLYVLFFLLICSSLFGQSNTNLNCRFRQLFISGNMQTWAMLVDSLQNSTLSSVEDDILLFAEYGLIGYYLGQDRKSEAGVILKQFDQHLDKCLLTQPKNANYHAFKAAAYGFKIGLSPWKAPVLSVYHQYRIDKSFEFRRNEYLPLIEQGNSYYFRPRIVGGNKAKALIQYQKANHILQKQKECNWMFLSNTAWLGQVYTKLNMENEARLLYLNILKEVPNFKYVKEELLPQLERGEFNDVGGKFEKLFE